jgi:hypothetical protein
MTAAEALALHRSRRPECPRPFIPTSPEAMRFQADLQAWVNTLERLESKVNCEAFALTPLDQNPKCNPRSEDYYFREPIRRKRRVA